MAVVGGEGVQGERLGDETLGRSEQDLGAGDGVLRWGAAGLDVRPPGGTPAEMARKGEVRLGGIFGEWLAGPDPDRRRDEKDAGRTEVALRPWPGPELPEGRRQWCLDGEPKRSGEKEKEEPGVRRRSAPKARFA